MYNMYQDDKLDTRHVYDFTYRWNDDYLIKSY